MGVILAVAAVVVLAAVVAIVVLRKKKAAPEPLPQPQPAPTPDPDPNDSGYRIQGVSGALEGRRYRIPASGSILLGRDESQCGVVFPSDTPGERIFPGQPGTELRADREEVNAGWQRNFAPTVCRPLSRGTPFAPGAVGR